MIGLMTKTLAQIVNSNHRAAAVFEKYHLDFCCKGKRSLEDACAEKNLPVDEIIVALEKTNGNSCSVPVDYDRLTLARLADYIVTTHHAYVKKEMPILLGYLQKVASKHGGHHPEMIQVMALFTAIKEEMDQHMLKEERILFPRIKEIETQLSEGKKIVINNSFLEAPVNMMEKEHEHAGSLLADIRMLTNDYHALDDACTTYRLSFAALQAFELDLHKHIHLENNILFPKALKMFGHSQQCSLN